MLQTPLENVLEKGKREAPDNHSNKNVKITIAIPAYNERGTIRSLLQSLLKQVNDGVEEIIVNTEGSTDGTADEVAKMARSLQGSLRVWLITGEKRMGKAAALDGIVRQATGGIIVFIDADTIIGKHSLSNIIEPFFKDEMIGVVGGNVLSLNDGDELFSFTSRFQRELHHELCLYLRRRNLPPKVNGTFFAVRRDVLKGFPYLIISDDEYASWCAQAHGYKVVYVPEAIVYTKDPTNLKDHIIKRRRILAGHILIKKSLNYIVPTTNFVTVSVNFLRLALKHWRKMLHITVTTFIELLCWGLALYDVIRHKVSNCYRVNSAKFTSTSVGD